MEEFGQDIKSKLNRNIVNVLWMQPDKCIEVGNESCVYPYVQNNNGSIVPVVRRIREDPLCKYDYCVDVKKEKEDKIPFAKLFSKTLQPHQKIWKIRMQNVYLEIDNHQISNKQFI